MAVKKCRGPHDFSTSPSDSVNFHFKSDQNCNSDYSDFEHNEKRATNKKLKKYSQKNLEYRLDQNWCVYFQRLL